MFFIHVLLYGIVGISSKLSTTIVSISVMACMVTVYKFTHVILVEVPEELFGLVEVPYVAPVVNLV